MPISDMLPWNRNKSRYDLQPGQDDDPLEGLQSEKNTLFDNFFGAPFTPELRSIQYENAGFDPRVDISETDKETIVHADLPGMDEKDIKLTIQGTLFTISGSREKETAQKDARYHRVERQYGSFQRSFTLPAEVDFKKVDATFRKGVLKVVIPKPPGTRGAIRKIPIKTK